MIGDDAIGGASQTRSRNLNTFQSIFKSRARPCALQSHSTEEKLMAYRRRDREFERRLCEIADQRRLLVATKPRPVVRSLREEIARILSQCFRAIGGKGTW